MLFSDITERKRAEEELRVAAQRKDEFIAMLAHQLRNPLAPIRVKLLVSHTSEFRRSCCEHDGDGNRRG